MKSRACTFDLAMRVQRGNGKRVFSYAKINWVMDLVCASPQMSAMNRALEVFHNWLRSPILDDFAAKFHLGLKKRMLRMRKKSSNCCYVKQRLL